MKHLRGLIADKLLWWAYLIYDLNDPIKDKLGTFILVSFPHPKKEEVGK